MILAKDITAKIFYIVGASGAGKDSLINQCRGPKLTELGCIVAHRYITRAAGAGGENHIPLTTAEFEYRRSVGCFAMFWEANGHLYGIGSELGQWLASGCHVIVNGSRAYLPQAIEEYGSRLLPVHIKVSAETLKRRLLERGRESAEAIERRIERTAKLADVTCDSALVVNNEGSLEDAAGDLMVIIRGLHC